MSLPNFFVLAAIFFELFFATLRLYSCKQKWLRRILESSTWMLFQSVSISAIKE